MMFTTPLSRRARLRALRRPRNARPLPRRARRLLPDRLDIPAEYHLPESYKGGATEVMNKFLCDLYVDLAWAIHDLRRFQSTWFANIKSWAEETRVAFNYLKSLRREALKLMDDITTLGGEYYEAEGVMHMASVFLGNRGIPNDPLY